MWFSLDIALWSSLSAFVVAGRSFRDSRCTQPLHAGYRHRRMLLMFAASRASKCNSLVLKRERERERAPNKRSVIQGQNLTTLRRFRRRSLSLSFSPGIGGTLPALTTTFFINQPSRRSFASPTCLFFHPLRTLAFSCHPSPFLTLSHSAGFIRTCCVAREKFFFQLQLMISQDEAMRLVKLPDLSRARASSVN